MKRPLVVATTNSGKVAELTPLLESLGYEVYGLERFPDATEPVEDGNTFEENALIKGKHYATITGMDVLADDSGLCVIALDGAPGVHSSRFAGPDATDDDNNRLLVESLATAEDRSAYFACVLALVRHGKRIAVVEGRCEGSIAEAPRGTGGFGYDPLFVPGDPIAQGQTFGETRAELKLQLSHRSAALHGLQAMLSRETANEAPGDGAGA